MSPIKLLNKQSFKMGIKLLLKAVGCGSFVTIIVMFVADIIYIAVLYPFIHRFKSKVKAGSRIKALKVAVKGKVSVKDYFEHRNKYVKEQLNED